MVAGVFFADYFFDPRVLCWVFGVHLLADFCEHDVDDVGVHWLSVSVWEEEVVHHCWPVAADVFFEVFYEPFWDFAFFGGDEFDCDWFSFDDSLLWFVLGDVV